MSGVAAAIEVDSARIQSRLDALHAIGARPSGGVFRGAYDQHWARARDLIAGWFREADLETRVDPVGNVWGVLAGREPGPPIVAGSHFDSVPDGGKYDGPLGVVGALVAVEALRSQVGTPRRTIAVLATCEEEDSRFDANFWASRAILGQIGPDEAARIRDREGVTLADAMRAVGHDPARIAGAKAPPIAAFLELHIEQGPVLEWLAREQPGPTVVGAVTAITGIGRCRVTLRGQPDHAGTTPMVGRRDALLGAAEVALALRELALGAGDPAVITVGRVELEPNIPNVVPGLARFSLDVRHPDRDTVRRLVAASFARAREVAAARGLECATEEIFEQTPTPMAADLVRRVKESALRLGLRPVEIVAGAGHDAQLLGRACPAAMVFVVTRNGRSHCPDEYAAPEDCAAGVATLAETIRSLAY